MAVANVPAMTPLDTPEYQSHTLRVSDPFAKEQLAKHQAGQFEWVLTLPVTSCGLAKNLAHRRDSESDTNVASENRKLYFACNVLHRRTRSIGDMGYTEAAANTYTLIATPIKGDEGMIETPIIEPEHTMTQTQVNGATPTSSKPAALHIETMAEPRRVSPKTLVDGPGSGPSMVLGPRSPNNPDARIEDSFEMLDRMQEEFEAMESIMQVERVPSPDKMPVGEPKPTSTRTAPVSTKPGVKPGCTRVKTASVSRAGSVRKSNAPTETNGKEAPETSPKKPAICRPASLLPPKALAKSSKPPTKPTFELPGEAVARRLKEQREARMSMMVTMEKPTPPIQRIRSTKQPTRPTFELPGEAISRRKREEHAAKLKAQEEEERRRREFKARPIRSSIAPGTLPRETAASRARQNKAASAETAAPTAVSAKRQSMAASSRPALSITSNSSQPRGRDSAMHSPSTTTQASRAASSSAGSMSGKRSTISAEDVQNQRVRGKEIVRRDNSFGSSRERERREREDAAKHARQEAAERSRALSREWAEKQKMKLKKAMTGNDANSAKDVAVR